MASGPTAAFVLAVTAILPKVSRFSGGGGAYGDTKTRVLDRLSTFVDRFLGLGGTSNG